MLVGWLSSMAWGEEDWQDKMASRMAVFVRNHREFLEVASRLSSETPGRFITFRSAKRWRAAQKALADQGSLDVYFSAVGGKGVIEYKATLHRVLIGPQAGDPETEELLRLELPETKGEGLWAEYGSKVRTLYVITNCHFVDQTFPQTELVKVKNDEPISVDYGYSYVPVWEHIPSEEKITIHPEEIAEPHKYREGSVCRVTVNAYERNTLARNRCIDIYGCRCCVCGFDFEDTYGHLGKGFIHVHHLRSLARLGKTYEVDPKEDLRPVCPNCHAMLHREEPCLSIEMLRKRLARG